MYNGVINKEVRFPFYSVQASIARILYNNAGIVLKIKESSSFDRYRLFLPISHHGTPLTRYQPF
jgi:hypothetical protein